jgi:hypothetical protein
MIEVRPVGALRLEILADRGIVLLGGREIPALQVLR